jgi:hypothetical protein
MNYLAQNRPDRAEAPARRALAIFEKTLGPSHPHYAAMLVNCAGVLKRLGKNKEAAELEARAARIRGEPASVVIKNK